MALMTKSCQFIAEHVYQQTHEPKRLIIYKRAGQGLDESSEDVYDLVYGWFVNNHLPQDTF